MSSYFADDRRTEGVETAARNDPLVRFAYAPIATFFMARYDSGIPGDPYAYVFASVVPRVLWPDKPLIGGAGARAYFILRGQEGTSIGMTHFAEAYWALGWWGILIFIPGGLILSVIAWRGTQLILDERWFQLPLVLITLNMGQRVAGHWVSDIVGTFAMFIVLSVIFSVAEKVFREFIAPLTTRSSRQVFGPLPSQGYRGTPAHRATVRRQVYQRPMPATGLRPPDGR